MPYSCEYTQQHRIRRPSRRTTRKRREWLEYDAAGDVDLAIRAYHRGLDAALDDKGTVYHTRVVRVGERYIRTQRASDSWRLLARTIRSGAVQP